MKPKNSIIENKTKRVGVVFPCYNRKELTLLCLKSLSRINTKGIDLQIILVDDGSTDGTSDAVKNDFPEVEIIYGDGNLWFTEGTNVGVRRALEKNCDYVLMMNDDQVFDSEFLQYMVETAEKYPRSVIGSLLLLWDQPHKLFQISPEWKTFSGGWRHWGNQTIWTIPEKPWKVEIIVGNCLLVPRKAFEECGLMDSKKFPNFGDAEFTPRLKKNGWTLLIEPRARVFCQPNTLPPKISNMNLKEKIRVLIFDLKNVHNLRRKFYGYIYAAPTKIHGLTAFGIFFVRMLLKINYENQSFAEKNTELPLKERYASSVVFSQQNSDVSS